MLRASSQKAVYLAGLAVLSATSLVSVDPARAADVVYAPATVSAPVLTPKPVSAWTITIGAEGRMMPEFEGATSSEFRPVPIFRIRRTGSKDRFRSAFDGFSIALFESGRFAAGPTAKFRYRRKEGDSDSLRGLGDVDWTLEVGAFAEFWPTDWLRTRAELRQGMGGHHGVVADLSADIVQPVTSQLTLSGGPRLTLSSASAVSPYFDITAAQSAASGLPVYDAGGGLSSYGVGAKARYAWTPQWASHVFVEYSRLAGDVANSPLVAQRGSRDQIQVGIGTTYSFDVPGLW
ncbi:MAG: MipA/OmpV family protein [Rhodopseudomonas sp.]|nr:MipA/OmpV family protein [Rhodopseudomonas sp.]